MSLPITLQDLSGLSLDERLKLVDLIWESIEAESLPDEPSEAEDLPQALKEELDRRLAAYQANPTAGSSWEEVRARLLGRSGDHA